MSTTADEIDTLPPVVTRVGICIPDLKIEKRDGDAFLGGQTKIQEAGTAVRPGKMHLEHERDDLERDWSLSSRLGTRFLSTRRDSPSRIKFHKRSVFLLDVPTPLHISTFLDQARVGPIESIYHNVDKSQAYIHFLDSDSAATFVTTLKEATPQPRVQLFEGDQEWRLQAEVIAAIGYHHASRCIVINPIPQSVTEDSLKEVLSRFGQVEKLELIKKSQGRGESFARVHFFSIKSALRARSALRMEDSMTGASVHFGLDRFDYSFQKHLITFKSDPKRPLEPLSRNVLLSNFSSYISARKVLSLVYKAAVSLHGEVVQHISTWPVTKQIYLMFMRPEDPSLFVNTFNTHVSNVDVGVAVRSTDVRVSYIDNNAKLPEGRQRELLKNQSGIDF
ncbi:hypothetical protein L218DRAFT_1072267 [Marasmius fiardii PR-910]|nr:hypothetical protein L218DRAFT_1072267 [Marasmius fiardii PR-910]